MYIDNTIIVRATVFKGLYVILTSKNVRQKRNNSIEVVATLGRRPYTNRLKT